MNRRHLVALAAVGALTLAACGSDDDDSADEPASTEAAEEPAATEAMEESEEGGEGASDVPADWPDSIVFTLTPSQEAGGLIETAEPLADMLSERLGIEVEALVPTDYAGVIAALAAGQAQVAGGLGPRQMVQAEEQAGAELILQAERFGSLLYVTQWFTNDPDTYCDDELRSPTRTASCSATACSTPRMRPTARSEPTSSDSSRARPCRSSTRARPPATPSRRCSWSRPASTRSTASTACSPVATTDRSRPCTTVTPRSACRSTTPAAASPRPPPTSANRSSSSAGRARSRTTASPSPATCPTRCSRPITEAFVEIAGTEDGAAVLAELYEIDDLVPVTSSDYDVIRDLEVALGDSS